MLLAEFMYGYPDELRADFQETYNLNIDDMGVTYSIGHASVLCAQLPKTSRVFRAINPDLEWELTHQLLAWIEYDLRALSGQGGKIKPLLPDAYLPDDMRSKKHVSMSIEEFDAFLKRNRKEVT